MLPVLLLLVISAAAGVWLWLHRERRDRLWRWAWLVPGIAISAIIALIVTDLAVQKVVGTVLMPAGLLWLGLIAATAIAALGRHWWTTGLSAAALLLYTACGNVWLGCALLAGLERQVLPAPDVDALAPFDAICVLGGGTDLMPDGSPRLNGSGDRILLGARLFLAGKTPILVAGGQSIDGVRSLGEETRTLWGGLGIPASAVVIVPEPRVTRTEMDRYHALCRERGWKRVAVVSSAWHLPRVLSHARRLEWDVTPLACDARSRPYPADFLWLIPQSRGFERMELACWERLGRWIGR